MTLLNSLDAALVRQIRSLLAATGERGIQLEAATAKRILGKLETAVNLKIVDRRG